MNYQGTNGRSALGGSKYAVGTQERTRRLSDELAGLSYAEQVAKAAPGGDGGLRAPSAEPTPASEFGEAVEDSAKLDDEVSAESAETRVKAAKPNKQKRPGTRKQGGKITVGGAGKGKDVKTFAEALHFCETELSGDDVVVKIEGIIRGGILWTYGKGKTTLTGGGTIDSGHGIMPRAGLCRVR